MVRSRGFVVFSLAAALLAVPVAATATASGIGASGVGDRFFPLAGNGGYDVGHYHLDLGWNPSTHVLSGTARIDATATQRLTQFDLDLRGFRVSRVLVNRAFATFVRHGQELVVHPARALRPREPMHIEVHYSGVPKPVTDPDGSVDGWVTTDDGAVVLAEPQGAPTWFPANDHPSDKATFTVSMTVPNGLQVLGNGLPVRPVTHGARTTHVWREVHPMAPYLATIAIGKFAITTSRSRAGIPIINAVDPRLAAASRAALQHTGDIIDWEASVFGPYPFESAGAIADYAPSVGYALETQTRPVFTFPVDDLSLVHEFAHQWFGDSVSVHTWPEIWLNEGFATFAEWLWLEHAGGPTTHTSAADLYRSIAATDPFWKSAPGPLSLPGPVQLFSAPVYERGALTLQVLRDTIGDRAFFSVLRRWASERRGGTGSTTQFIALAEQVSGRNLHPLFHAWLDTPSRPPFPGA